MIVEVDYAFASPCTAGLFGNQDSMIAGNHLISFRAGTSQRSAKFLKDVSGHLPSEIKFTDFRATQPHRVTIRPIFFQGAVKHFSSFSTPSTRTEEQIVAGRTGDGHIRRYCWLEVTLALKLC